MRVNIECAHFVHNDASRETEEPDVHLNCQRYTQSGLRKMQNTPRPSLCDAQLGNAQIAHLHQPGVTATTDTPRAFKSASAAISCTARFISALDTQYVGDNAPGCSGLRLAMGLLELKGGSAAAMLHQCCWLVTCCL
jgi:hypothetical protein